MKKFSKILIALIVGIVLIFGMAGCKPNAQKDSQGDNGNSQGTVTGSENGSDGNTETPSEEEESVGALYTLQEAYDNGLLTREDLLSIAYYQGSSAQNEELTSGNYQPAPKTPEVLSGETELKIKSATAKYYREVEDIKNAEADSITILRYFGTYGDCVAVMVQDPYFGFFQVPWTDTVGGVNINYSDGREIKIWCNAEQVEEEESVGTLYTLQEAYDNGLLTREDLLSIAYYHNGGRKGNETVMGDDYTPQPKTPEALDNETDLAIKRDYWIANYARYNPHGINLDQIDYAYYGCYGKCIVVKIAYFPYPADAVYGEVYYGDVKIIYTYLLELSVWIPTER